MRKNKVLSVLWLIPASWSLLRTMWMVFMHGFRKQMRAFPVMVLGEGPKNYRCIQGSGTRPVPCDEAEQVGDAKGEWVY